MQVRPALGRVLDASRITIIPHARYDHYAGGRRQRDVVPTDVSEVMPLGEQLASPLADQLRAIVRLGDADERPLVAPGAGRLEDWPRGDQAGGAARFDLGFGDDELRFLVARDRNR